MKCYMVRFSGPKVSPSTSTRTGIYCAGRFVIAESFEDAIARVKAVHPEAKVDAVVHQGAALESKQEQA